MCPSYFSWSSFHAHGLYDRLKDCDVTWLYGPLHTAVDWTSPPKPPPVPDSVESVNPASAHDRLDLSTSRGRPHKPILKHRSISEFLTCDFPPTSPVLGPVDSEGEPHATDSTSTTKGKRPALPHTKSDTHITRWAHSRGLRKDSPPRIDPPGFDSKTQTATGYFPPSTSLLSAQAPSGIRPSISQDSNSSTSGTTSGGSGGEKHPVQKKKHISFNTFVEQYIAIEKPKKNASGFFGPGNHNDDGLWIEGRSAYVDDDGSVHILISEFSNSDLPPPAMTKMMKTMKSMLRTRNGRTAINPRRLRSAIIVPTPPSRRGKMKIRTMMASLKCVHLHHRQHIVNQNFRRARSNRGLNRKYPLPRLHHPHPRQRPTLLLAEAVPPTPHRRLLQIALYHLRGVAPQEHHTNREKLRFHPDLTIIIIARIGRPGAARRLSALRRNNM